MRFGRLVENTVFEIDSKLTIAFVFALIALAAYLLGMHASHETTLFKILT